MKLLFCVLLPLVNSTYYCEHSLEALLIKLELWFDDEFCTNKLDCSSWREFFLNMGLSTFCYLRLACRRAIIKRTLSKFKILKFLDSWSACLHRLATITLETRCVFRYLCSSICEEWIIIFLLKYLFVQDIWCWARCKTHWVDASK